MEAKWQNWRELLDKKEYVALRKALEAEEAIDIADFLEELEETKLALVFRMLSKEKASEAFSRLAPESQELLVNSYSDEEVAEVVAGLYNDDLADLLEELPARVANRVLAQSPPNRRQLVNKLLQYPDDSAGSAMTTEYVRFAPEDTVGEAIRELRRGNRKIEMLYSCYITSKERKLLGVVSVRDILHASDDASMDAIMDHAPTACHTEDDQEDVAALFSRYGLLAMPVLDKDERMVGLITIDDVVDILKQESSEDLSLMNAVAPSETPYLDTGVWDNVRRRFVWLLVLMLSGSLNSIVLAQYQPFYVALPILVGFIPMLTGAGGNASSQATALQINAIALGQSRLSWHDLFAVLWKELRVGLLVGGCLSLLNAVRVYFAYGQNLSLALTLFFSLLIVMTMADLVGGFLPYLSLALHLDPAMVAAPVITTIVDVLGLVIYFGIARIFLAGTPLA